VSIDKNISKALDIEPVDVTVIEVKEFNSNTAIVTKSTQVTPTVYEDQEDFELSRDTMRDLIQKGVHKLDEFGALASDLETARAYEVYGGMLEKIANLTEKLYDMHQRKKDLRGDAPQPINIEKGIVFTGNQTEMLQELKKQNGNG
jgi:c-di-GMP-binding flagellar brake protein YcgR